jgi:hypothetical protein
MLSHKNFAIFSLDMPLLLLKFIKYYIYKLPKISLNFLLIISKFKQILAKIADLKEYYEL